LNAIIFFLLLLILILFDTGNKNNILGIM